jgi:hypothetical protein
MSDPTIFGEYGRPHCGTCNGPVRDVEVIHGREGAVFRVWCHGDYTALAVPAAAFQGGEALEFGTVFARATALPTPAEVEARLAAEGEG